MPPSDNTEHDNTYPDTDSIDSEADAANKYIPTWSAFNTALEEPTQQLTHVCVLPLISASPTDNSVQLKFLNEVERLTKQICGQTAKCVVTVDMGLYKPIQQLVMSRTDLRGRWILRPGELHIAFAFIRAIGSFIDGNGIPDLWFTVYSDSTVSSIIAGKNFRRSLEAHVRTLVALQQCYFAAFFEHHQTLRTTVHKTVQEVCNNFISDASGTVETLKGAMIAWDLTHLMKTFDERECEAKHTFRMIRQYMHMVELLLLFIRATRTGNWGLHLVSVEQMVKYFFALDLTNYSGMMAWYLGRCTL